MTGRGGAPDRKNGCSFTRAGGSHNSGRPAGGSQSAGDGRYRIGVRATGGTGIAPPGSTGSGGTMMIASAPVMTISGMRTGLSRAGGASVSWARTASATSSHISTATRRRHSDTVTVTGPTMMIGRL